MQESQRDGARDEEKMLGAMGVWLALMIKKIDAHNSVSCNKAALILKLSPALTFHSDPHS